MCRPVLCLQPNTISFELIKCRIWHQIKLVPSPFQYRLTYFHFLLYGKCLYGCLIRRWPLSMLYGNTLRHSNYYISFFFLSIVCVGKNFPSFGYAMLIINSSSEANERKEELKEMEEHFFFKINSFRFNYYSFRRNNKNVCL